MSMKKPAHKKVIKSQAPAQNLSPVAAPVSDTISAEMNKSFHLTIPLEKVSQGPNGEVFVEGFLARVDTPDKTPGMPEQMDEALSTPNFEKWVHETQERSKGLSLFNAREGHNSVIMAGRGVEFKHVEGVGYWGKSEVVDPVTKEKVLKGVVTSHSIGGHYGKKWIEKGVLRYEAQPIEVSYVDVPMIPGTEFQFQHADGSTEMRKFVTVDAQPTPETQTPPEPNQPVVKALISKYAALRKEDGGYEVNAAYAQQEAWDITRAAQALEQVVSLMSSESIEPEDAREVAAIAQALLVFMMGENKEMVAAATGASTETEGEEEASEEAEPQEAEEPEPADNAGAEEAEKGDEEEAEEDAEPEPEMDVEKVRGIVRSVLAEMQEVAKAEQAGELAKANSLIASKAETLEKSIAKVSQDFEKSAKALAKDIAGVVSEHNALEVTVALLQKAVDSYGPVTRVVPPQGPVLNNPEGLPEKDLLKSLLANPRLTPQIRQAYQARLTELEIKGTKPLEEPPSFVS
jgi:hypothetical protein